IKNDLKKAGEVWENTNIKEIRYAELEDFLHPSGPEDKLYGLSPKTRANTKSTLRDFWDWLVKREIIRHHEVPRFPKVSFHLSIRNTIDKETQERILDELYRLTKDFNIRIWIGIRFLATYVNVRPKELINIRESHIDLQQGRILIPHPKEGKPKYMYLIEEDINLLQSMPRGLPDLYFFRHLKGNGAARPGQRFGHDYLWKWWKKACSNLGIEGVDLYGGTRHSTVIYLRELGHSPEAVKRASMHSTNKAFERYLQVTASEVRSIYADARCNKRKRCKQNEPGFVYTL
ncbi:MAG: tyrosine-type recombinase/integrase, partial [Deltaproteobacteria bacterium]|nr:tyrosine-type recombinase/integrase [Deltaproteobacteria bacterium]